MPFFPASSACIHAGDMSLPDVRTIYLTLKDIALGMTHIHANGIVHCDLNGMPPLATTLAPADQVQYS
jgi:hypothetical protein